MNSAQWLLFYVFGGIAGFIAWELIQLARRRAGNESARTFTQYVMRRARAGSLKYKILITAFPIFWFLIGIWLWFHFEVMEIVWGW